MKSSLNLLRGGRGEKVCLTDWFSDFRMAVFPLRRFFLWLERERKWTGMIWQLLGKCNFFICLALFCFLFLLLRVEPNEFACYQMCVVALNWNYWWMSFCFVSCLSFSTFKLLCALHWQTSQRCKRWQADGLGAFAPATSKYKSSFEMSGYRWMDRGQFFFFFFFFLLFILFLSAWDIRERVFVDFSHLRNGRRDPGWIKKAKHLLSDKLNIFHSPWLEGREAAAAK